MMHPRIAARVFNTPLMVHPGKAAAMVQGMGGRILDAPVRTAGAEPVSHVAFQNRPLAGVIGDRLGSYYASRGALPYAEHRGVAVLPIEGSLIHKGAFVESDSGETSYEGIMTQAAAVIRDATRLKGCVLEIDSYGGEVSGAFQAADMLNRISQVMPTMAILTDSAYSAGYLMASAARQIVLPESGGAGSIGVITMHTDFSRALEAQGVTVTILAAGAHKADGNPYEPLPEDVATSIRAELEDMRRMFAGAVGKYRGNRLTEADAMATEAQTFMGAEAVKRGLADATAQPLDAFEAFVSQLNRA